MTTLVRYRLGLGVLGSIAAGVLISSATRETHRHQDRFSVSIVVDAGKPIGEMKPMWRFFGADEPNEATQKNGAKLIGELGKLKSRNVYFRTHNLLTTGDGKPALKWGSTNAYTETPEGKAVYDWKIVDDIFDTYLKRGVRPYVEIGFMPEALSTRPEPYRHHWTPSARYEEIYTGWTYPPKDYAKWGELVYQWAKHCVERYGKSEVEKWYWEVWNEPNIGYWQGTRAEFLKLHTYAIDGVRRALPTARVGGPDIAGSDPRFLRTFIDQCAEGNNPVTGTKGVPFDFISFHAKGAPSFVDGHVRMGIANQLRTIDDGFATVSSFHELKNMPIVIGESDPDGCAACQGPQLGYRNGTMYSSYTAASFARAYELADRHGVNLEGELTWAFQFEDTPFFAGFRVLATNGIALPVLNVFRMYSKMSGERIAATSDGAIPLAEIMAKGVRTRPDVSALAALDKRKLAVMVWHYVDDDVPGISADVNLSIQGLPVSASHAKVTEYRIDEAHANAFSRWQKMGSPEKPTAAQYAELERASQLDPAGPTQNLQVADGALKLQTLLPRKAIALFVVNW